MDVIWTMQEPPETMSRGIFLAGPTPRGDDGRAWRTRALELLEELGYDGAVFVPEPEDGSWRRDYTGQIMWEERCLHLADVIVFWVPRELETMPAFTTNIEWGMWYDSGKVVLGAPEDAPKMRYLRAYADRFRVPQATTLRDTLALALKHMGDGVPREGGWREVPLELWKTPEFERWRRVRQEAGHRLDGARMRWQHRTRRGELFAWALQVDVHIPQESRNKGSEVIVARPDIACVLAYLPGATLEETHVVLVREFRSASTAPDGYVLELPGGSSPEPGVDPREQAIEELEEETGVRLSPERLKAHGSRPCLPTLLTHHAHLFSVELTPEELEVFQARRGQVFGAHDSERTTVHVRRVGALMREPNVDWGVLGMICQALSLALPCDRA